MTAPLSPRTAESAAPRELASERRHYPALFVGISFRDDNEWLDDRLRQLRADRGPVASGWDPSPSPGVPVHGLEPFGTGRRQPVRATIEEARVPAGAGVPQPQGVVMNRSAHLIVTQIGLEPARRLQANPQLLRMPTVYPDWFPADARAALLGVDVVACKAPEYDDRTDVELIDVEWPRDEDPHSGNDEPHLSALGHSFAGLTRFMDIGKGPGLFDDYDGYSYERGSASHDEHQTIADQRWGTGEWADLVSFVSGSLKVDEGINYWLGRVPSSDAPGPVALS